MLHILFCVCFGIGDLAPLMERTNDQINKFNCRLVSFVCDGGINKHIVIWCDVLIFAIFGFALDLVSALQFVNKAVELGDGECHCIIPFVDLNN